MAPVHPPEALGEAALIAAIRRIFAQHEALAEEDDDDTARIDGLFISHVSVDVAVEGKDFDRALAPLRYFGHRVVAQNLSDLYAADCEPRGFVWSLAIPDRWSLDDVEAFCVGAATLAGAMGMPLLGGDLSSVDGPFSCSITAMGHAPGIPLRRRGARAGQHLWLSKPCGAAAAGLRALMGARVGDDEATFATWLHGQPEAVQRAVLAQLAPMPAHPFDRLSDFAVAAIDVSDGLTRDASRLAAASGLDLALEDLGRAVDVAAGATLEDALAGGEDWAILAAIPEGLEPDGGILLGRFQEAVDGTGGGLFVDGKRVAPQGFDHFRR